MWANPRGYRNHKKPLSEPPGKIHHLISAELRWGLVCVSVGAYGVHGGAVAGDAEVRVDARVKQHRHYSFVTLRYKHKRTVSKNEPQAMTTSNNQHRQRARASGLSF